MTKVIVTDVQSGYCVVHSGPAPYIVFGISASIGDELEVEPTMIFNHRYQMFVAKFVKKLDINSETNTHAIYSN